MLTVVAGNPPDVWVGETKKTILAHERVALEGFYRASVQPVRVQWSCLRESGRFGLFLCSFLSASSSQHSLDNEYFERIVTKTLQQKLYFLFLSPQRASPPDTNGMKIRNECVFEKHMKC